MSDDLVPITDLLPPARQYMAEEWGHRTWFGRWTLPGEALVVFIMRLMSHIHARMPAVYRSSNTEARAMGELLGWHYGIWAAIFVGAFNGAVGVVMLTRGDDPMGYFNAAIIAGFWSITMIMTDNRIKSEADF